MKRYNLSWGNPYFLTKLLDESYTQSLKLNDISSMVYGPDEGVQEMIDLVKYSIKETTGLKYDHILIVPGATSGINSCLRYFKNSKGKDLVITNKYGYPFYDEMIKKAGLERFDELKSIVEVGTRSIVLVDSPSNPFGTQIKEGLDFVSPSKIIWDSVYHNIIYTTDLITYPQHDIMVGSFSKLLGVAGTRIGWIATNKPFLYEMLKAENLYETATVSIPSQNLLIDILEKLDLQKFMLNGKRILDNNRGELARLSSLFSNQPVQETGMFYCAKADQKLRDLIDRAGVDIVSLDEEYVRISMGQTNEVTKAAVDAILKEDKSE